MPITYFGPIRIKILVIVAVTTELKERSVIIKPRISSDPVEIAHEWSANI